MTDPRIEKLANVLVRYSTNVKRNETVFIKADPITQPLAVAIYTEVLRAGGHPWMRLVPDECTEMLYSHGNDEQIAFASPIDKHIISTVNVLISLWGMSNTKALSRVDPAKQALSSKARKSWLSIFMKRMALPEKDPKRLRWVGTAFPTNAAAQEAEMSLREYQEFVFRAGKLHMPNPAAAWKKAGVAQQRLCDTLDKCREMHIKIPGGTDLRFAIKGRKWINCQGFANFPDGEVFTAPIEDATEGTVAFNFPTVYGGREVNGVRLKFKAGKCIDASAEKNEAYLIKMLDQDRGARIVGELALGTNYEIKQFSKDTLFDEKIGGTFHMAMGAAYPEAGGKNESGLHWDMVCNLRKGGVVTADGKVITKNGKFQKAAWPR